MSTYSYTIFMTVAQYDSFVAAASVLNGDASESVERLVRNAR